MTDKIVPELIADQRGYVDGIAQLGYVADTPEVKDAIITTLLQAARKYLDMLDELWSMAEDRIEGQQIIGYEACWHEDGARHCRMPRGHQGEHAYA